eukprot:CAMPEP_0194265100 /NCGR_PEP_ID=MMETSP0169-20130528/444_1 /TAXON_ID=218684 /ORGANISM="Corethron pennatum, Strain L29A3" /LENGTH=553 /DNA_ID=CAMNT_0039005499 /DNA_START=51 /DNA_END=1709 /DNA_ORIENTATION=-
MLRAATSVAGKATGAALVGGSGYGAYLYQTDEGTSRMIKAYGNFAPVVLSYRFLEAKEKLFPGTVTENDWSYLDKTYAKPTIERLGELQGMYTKYGQIAAGMTNTLSDTWIQELRRLESDVPPRSIDVVHKTIEEELGVPVDAVFDWLDPKPLGSASIGQVHSARLRGGTEVAVKVQYPEAGQLFRDDMKTIRKFFEILAPENVISLSALEKQNALELDYRMEADNLKQVEQNMRLGGFLPHEVIIPLPIGDFSTKRLLVMEKIPGPKLNDGVRAYFSEWAKQNGTTLEALEKEAKLKIEKEGIPSKYTGPSPTQIERYKFLLNVREKLMNSGIFAYNCTFGRFPQLGGKQKDYIKINVPLNLPRLVDTLMRVHGYQLMKDGLFNADPHGGNFLLHPDGRIGMIDYGATKKLTRNERLTACLLWAALYRNDEDLLWELSILGGYKSKYGRKDVLMKLMRFAYDTWGKDLMGNKNVQQFIDELKSEDPWEEGADNLVMASFMSIRLRSLALGMNHPVKCSDWWGPIAEEILKEEGLPYESWNSEQLEKYKVEPN